MHVKRDYFKCDTCGCEKEVDGDWLFVLGAGMVLGSSRIVG